MRFGSGFFIYTQFHFLNGLVFISITALLVSFKENSYVRFLASHLKEKTRWVSFSSWLGSIEINKTNDNSRRVTWCSQVEMSFDNRSISHRYTLYSCLLSIWDPLYWNLRVCTGWKEDYFAGQFQSHPIFTSWGKFSEGIKKFAPLQSLPLAAKKIFSILEGHRYLSQWAELFSALLKVHLKWREVDVRIPTAALRWSRHPFSRDMGETSYWVCNETKSKPPYHLGDICLLKAKLPGSLT